MTDGQTEDGEVIPTYRRYFFSRRHKTEWMKYLEFLTRKISFAVYRVVSILFCTFQKYCYYLCMFVRSFLVNKVVARSLKSYPCIWTLAVPCNCFTQAKPFKQQIYIFTIAKYTNAYGFFCLFSFKIMLHFSWNNIWNNTKQVLQNTPILYISSLLITFTDGT